MKTRKEQRLRRHKRVRAKISGTAKVPRLSVFKSLSHLYAQLIDDEKGKVLASVSDLKMKDKKDLGKKIGLEMAKLAKELKIEKVVFDRGGYKYHGKVKAVAEGAREGGLKF